MTDEELKELIASLAIAQKKTDEKFQKTDEKFQKTDEKFQKTDKLIRELGKQIGGLGNKFGSFTEGMAFPSMTKILKEQFGMEIIATRVKAEHNGKKLELDVFAYTNGSMNTAFIIEVKSHVKQEDLQQLLKTLTIFPKVFPEHTDKKLYAILTYVDMADNVKAKILEQGIYLARIHDEQFKLQVPKKFQAQSFGAMTV